MSWLTNAGLKTLNRNHENVCLLKGEGPVTAVQRTIEETEGAFDVAVGAMIKAWGFYRRQGRVPSEAERHAALDKSGTQIKTDTLAF